MGDYEHMELAIDGPIARMTLNRPEALNAMPHPMVVEMDAIAERLQFNQDIRLVVLTGAGRAFSAGIDLKALAAGEIGEPYLDIWERFLRRLETMDKIVLCLLHGYFIGGGLQLALACDIRVTTPTAKTGLPAVREGIIPSLGPWRLARHVGLGRAKQLTLLGNLIDGTEAYRIGLVEHVVSEDNTVEEFEEIVQQYLASASQGARAAKIGLSRALDMGFDEYFGFYMQLQLRTFEGDDFAEAKKAFLEGRTPDWR